MQGADRKGLFFSKNSRVGAEHDPKIVRTTVASGVKHVEVVHGRRCIGKGLERFPRPLLGRALKAFPGDEVTYTTTDAVVVPAI